MSDNKLVIDHFSKKYGENKNYAVKDINISVKAGEVFGFIGHNGAGKSTTIKSLVGIQPITEGSISIFGQDISKNTLEAKKLIGYVSDTHSTYEKLTGRKYLHTIGALYGMNKEDCEKKINELATDFNILDAMDNQIKNYSHGMKQKLVIIASLIHDPKLWVLDEPLTGLDPISAITLKEKMREHANKGNIVFFSSHIIEVVEKVCDRIGIIRKGELVCSYSMDELKEKNILLEDLYMKYVGGKLEDNKDE